MHKLVRELLVFAACLTWHHAKASPCMNGDDSSIELAYGGVPPADKWSWDAAGVHFTCNDANYFGTESVPVHESGNYDAACLQGGNSAWLQLDLGESMFVTGIVIQGRPDWEQYVKRYTVQGSIDDITWIDMPCKNKDSANRCIGSSDRSTKVTNEFAQVVNVRYVKLFVKDYHVYASLRMSVYISCPLSCPSTFYLEEFASGRILHYNFDGDLVDSIHPHDNNKNAILAGSGGIASLSSVQKISGSNSLRLLSDPGVNTYAILPSFQVNDKITISFWLNWNLAASYDYNYQKPFYFKDTSKDFKFYINRPNNQKKVDFTMISSSISGGWCNYKPSPDLADNVWYHIVMTLDINEEMKVYVDGVYYSASTGSAQCMWPASLGPVTFDQNYLGRHNAENKDNFDGYIDDFRIYNVALSAAQVLQLYEQQGDLCAACPAGTVSAAGSTSVEDCVVIENCPVGSTLVSTGVFPDSCVCQGNLRSDLGPIYDGRPPVSAWSYSALSSDASCSNPIDFGVHDGVDTATAGTACFAAVDADNYLQLDMSTEVIVTGVQTMGRASDAQYVTLYQVQVSNDGATWTNAPCAEVDASEFCVGNSDAGSVKQNDLASKVVARYVKLIVKGYSGGESLRMSVLAQTCVSCPNVAWQHYQPQNL